MRKCRILTWRASSAYLYYLGFTGQEIFVPVAEGQGSGRRCGTKIWPDNVHGVPAEIVRNLPFDCILFQSKKAYMEDQFKILSASQLRLPKIYLEHDPPGETAANSRHVVDDPNMLLVHCTHFNDLMWNCGRTPTKVIEHGVVVPEGCRYNGDYEKGIVVVNGLKHRGRGSGNDVFGKIRVKVPLDLIGLDSQLLGGLGEIKHRHLFSFISNYRFFFNPIRYAGLGLAVCEAMMLGMPVVGLATTEMSMIVENGISGWVDTDVKKLVEIMRLLLKDHGEAKRLGAAAKQKALERFNIHRFAGDWNETFAGVAGTRSIQAIGPDSSGERDARSFL